MHETHHVNVGAAERRLMIHCMLARHEVLLPLAGAVDGATLFDMPGHGKSADWDGASAYQAQVVQIAASLCDGPTHLIGHSFGATAALRLAVERPECVSQLTLIEPVFFAVAKGTDDYAAYAKKFRPFVAAMLQGEEARAAEIFNGLWSTANWADIPAAQRAYLTNRIHLVVASGAELEEDADGITSHARLGQVNVPVTLIRGERTQPVIGTIHDRLVQRLPNASDHLVAGAGHMLPLRKPFIPQVAAIIRAAETESR